ncbi:MAG TPA: peptide deformylase [Thermoanaerobaculia bacterium]|nr:peptide deformylase [Thermoanaerobaculia bacterium]
MAIRNIVKYGDPRLVAPNESVTDFDDPSLHALIEDLKETCWAAPGLGLAAPQIGVNRHVAIVDLSVGKDPSQVLVLINPVVVDTKGSIRDEEGCLSLPDLVETVERPEKVTIEAYDERGVKRALDGRELLARALCHEIDHLEQHLFLDRLSSLKKGLILRKVLKRRKQGAW